MLIRVGRSLESPGAVIMAGFKAQESVPITEKVDRAIDNRGNIPEIRYQTHGGEAYVRGYLVNPDKFHISQIVSRDKKVNEFPELLGVISSTITDLQERGVRQITTNCINKLVPVVIKRYGFEIADGSIVEDIGKKASGIITTPLIKNL